MLTRNTRILSLLLAACMLCAAFLTACGEEQSDDLPAAAATAAETAAAVTSPAETDRASRPDGLPELDYDGATVNILYRKVPNLPDYEMTAELTGDVVDDAVYYRNLKVSERLNLNLSFSGQGTAAANEVPAAATNAVMSGEDLFQIWVWQQARILRLVTSGYYTDMSDNRYIDLDQPWWNTSYMEQINIGSDRTYFYAGDVILSIISCLSMNMVNKSLYASLYGDINDLYNEVLDGNFTFERFSALVEGAYSDLNGDGTADDTDRYGITVTPVSDTELLAFAAGMTLSRRGSGGLPELDVMTERNTKVLNTVNDLYYANAGTLVVKETEIIDETMENRFASEQMLFLPKWFASTDLLRDMETDYGIVPFPKLDDTQDDYRALVHNIASTVAVPITCGDPDMIGALLEALAAESYRTVIPAYYEVSLKTKYARDDVTSQMIDLIYGAAFTDFAYAYSVLLGSVGTISRTVVGQQ